MHLRFNRVDNRFEGVDERSNSVESWSVSVDYRSTGVANNFKVWTIAIGHTL